MVIFLIVLAIVLVMAAFAYAFWEDQDGFHYEKEPTDEEKDLEFKK